MGRHRAERRAARLARAFSKRQRDGRGVDDFKARQHDGLRLRRFRLRSRAGQIETGVAALPR